MMKLGWINSIPREWIEITTKSLEEWRERDEKPPFLPDNWRGYARITPVALSRTGIPGSAVHSLDQYPRDGLGIYEDLETCDQYSGYMWSDWTTKTVQPMHIDEALQVMIDQLARNSAGTAVPSSHSNAQSVPSAAVVDKGSNMSSSFSASHSPGSSEDVSMETSVDKRSRESPDTTSKPDGKSLKTSESASPSPARHDTSGTCAADTLMHDVSVEQEVTSKPPTIRRKANDASEARLLTRQMHQRIPAWKLKMCVEALNARPIDHARVTEVTEIQYASDELVAVAAQCLADLARESESASDPTGHDSAVTAAHSQTEKDSTDVGQAPQEPEKEPEGAAEAPGAQSAEDKSHNKTGEQRATAQSSKQPTSSTAAPTQDATASLGKTTSEHDDDEDEADKVARHDWATRFLTGDHDLLWPSGPVSSTCPTLLTGLKMDTSDHLIDSLMEWERKFESADLEKHKQFLQEASYVCVIVL